MTIDYFSINHPLRMLASRISFHIRLKAFSSFMAVMKPDKDMLVLDVGVTPDQKLPESNFFEMLYPFKNRLVVTSIEDASFLERTYPDLTFLQTGKRDLPFKDHVFEIVFCSAVLEHVGNRTYQQAFIQELLRVSRNFFIITPNRQFPMEFHTFLPIIHWLPQSFHQAILRTARMNFWAQTSNLNLLSPSSLISLFPENINTHLIKLNLLGFPSNLIAFGRSIP